MPLQTWSGRLLLPLLLPVPVAAQGVPPAAPDSRADHAIEPPVAAGPACPPARRRAYAEHLRRSGDPYRAVGVLKELAFATSDAGLVVELNEEIARIYEQSERWEAAALAWEHVAELDPAGAGRHLLQAVADWMRADRCDRALAGLQRLEERRGAGGADGPGAGGLRFGAAVCAARLGRFEEARRLTAEVPPDDLLGRDADALADRLDRELPLPTKSPALAGVLSVLPGLGHLYVGDFAAAGTALVWNGLFGLASYEAYTEGLLATAALLGLFEAIWYAGTVYGAVNLASRHNRSLDSALRRDLLHEYRNRLPAGVQPPALPFPPAPETR